MYELKNNSKIFLNKDYSKVILYTDSNHNIKDNDIRESLMGMLEPFFDVDDKSNGDRIISLSVTSIEYMESIGRYIKTLEDTLGKMGVTVYKDARGEAYIGSKRMNKDD